MFNTESCHLKGLAPIRVLSFRSVDVVWPISADAAEVKYASGSATFIQYM